MRRSWAIARGPGRAWQGPGADLGLPADAWLATAKQHALKIGNLKEGVAATISPTVLLDAAALVTGETAGLDPEERAKFIGRGRPALEPSNPQRRALDAWVDANPDVALMIDCEQPGWRDSVKPAEILAKYDGVPLIRFRLAVCGGPGAPLAASIREANARFLDTLPWEARRALIGSQTEAIDLYKGAALLGQSTTSVYMLAGLIAYDRKDLPTAVLRFDRSFELDVTNCDAVWMGGLVRVDQQDWPQASPKFARAMSCFSNASAQAKSDLAALDAEVKRNGGSLNPPGREARQRAKLTRDMEVAAERSAQSAFNASQGYARIGQKALALAHVERAISHPRMKEKAEALKVAIEKMPQ